MKRINLINKRCKTLMNKVGSVGQVNLFTFHHWVRLLIWCLQLSPKPYKVFATRVTALWKKNGKTFTVLYLKECTRLVQHFVSGRPVFTTSEMPVGLSGGIPSIIPGTLRSLMRSGDQRTIRGVLSLLSVYRVIQIPCKLKLESITDPFKGVSDTLPAYEVINVLRGLGLPVSGRLQLSLNRTLVYLSTAGPNHSVSLLGIWKDLYAWYLSPHFPTLISFISKLKGGERLVELIFSEIRIWESTPGFKPSVTPLDLKLGKLSIKEEAAGKARVFAMADAITQSVMAPLSDWVFNFLKDLPMDGTFNQTGPLDRLVALYKEGWLHGETFYSFDLSSATDRLPISLQEQVLSYLFGKEFASQWRTILTDRDWYLKGIPYRYSVGQPMGALSSWAMLALTHHVIVRMAATRVGYPGFTNYALLGDDIVIANEAVANAYHEIMTQVLGVEINLSKSLVSTNSFEFAKRLVTMDGEVSAVGAKNLLVALKSNWGISSVLLDLTNKGLVLTEPEINNLFSSIPTVKRHVGERLKWLVLGPFGFIPSADGLTSSLKLVNSLSAVQMDIMLSCIDRARFDLDYKTWESNITETVDILTKLSLLSVPAGFESYPDFSSSPLFVHIRTEFGDKLSTLVMDKPVWRLLFDGPLVFINFYREGWMKEMMTYITSKIRNDSNVTVAPMDPFQSDQVVLPLRTNLKGESFFSKVKELMKDRDPTHAGRWM